MRIFLLSICVVTLLIRAAWAQERTVSGNVTSGADGSAIPGVNVIVKGTSSGAVTDLNGDYKLALPDDATTLVFSFVGMVTQEIEVGSLSVIDVALDEEMQMLEEFVVVGYGTQSKQLTTEGITAIGAKSFKNMPVLSPQEALQGQAAGVQMLGASGVIGAAATVRIRGVASLSSADPLYVVDGVPLNSESRTAGLGGASLNPISEINPSEIESVSVLKDAAAVAIYGSRGANGVILIKTKTGSKDSETQFNLDYYTGWSRPTFTKTMMNADQYREYYVDFVIKHLNAPGRPAFISQEGFDWPRAVLQTGRVNNYALSANGGNEKTTFYLGGTYLNQESYTIGNAADKINARVNLTHEAKDYLRFGVNLGLAKLRHNRISTDNFTSAPLTGAYLLSPLLLPRDENGDFVNFGYLDNVLAVEELSDYTTISYRTTGNFYAEWDIVPTLSIKTDFGVDMVQLEEFLREPDFVTDGGYGHKSIHQDNKWVSTNTLHYSAEYGDHAVGALAGYSFETSAYNNMTVEGTRFVNDDLPNVSSAASKSITDATSTRWALLSYFARLNYGYNSKYLLEVSARRDGSSRFAASRRFGNFYAVSAGWILSAENFLVNSSFVDFLKLYASYGTAGNDQIGNFGSQGLYSSGGLADYAGIPGLIPSQPASLQLGWEETSQLDVSVDFSTVKSRLETGVSYYLKNTKGILLEVPLPYTSGFATRNQNVGSLTNSGIDLTITSKNVQGKNFTWETSLNVGYLQQKVTSLPKDYFDPFGNPFVEGTPSQRITQGHTTNEFFLIRYKGINTETGEAEWLTGKGKITNAPTPDDRVYVGSALPDITGSLRNTITFREFDFTFMFSFVHGNKVMLNDMEFTDNPKNAGTYNLHTRVLNYWKQPGDNAYAPAFNARTFNNFAQNSTLRLFDGSYIRLRSVALGYSLSQAVTDNTFLRNARVYVMGTNLLTFGALPRQEVDPEVNGGGANPRDQGESFFTMPQAKTITVGVNIEF